MQLLTTLTPDELAEHWRAIIVNTPDGDYAILQFHTGQVIESNTYWWAVVRVREHWPEVYTTSLETAMSWLANALLERCF